MDADAFAQLQAQARVQARTDLGLAAATLDQTLQRRDITAAQRRSLQLQLGVTLARHDPERALALLDALLASSVLTDDQRAEALYGTVRATSMTGRVLSPDPLYALLRADLSPLARGQVLFALSHWHYAEQVDVHAGADLDDQLLAELHAIDDPEWRLRILSWTLPNGSGRQWSSDALANGREALALARQLGWTAQERQISEQLHVLYRARQDVKQALHWAERNRVLATELDDANGLGLYHIDLVSIALEAGDVAEMNRHWEALGALRSRMSLTTTGHRQLTLTQILVDRANGRWDAACRGLEACLDTDGPLTLDVLGTALRVQADHGTPTTIANLVADHLSLAPVAHDPFIAHLVGSAAARLDHRADVPDTLVRHVEVLAHRLAVATGHRRLQAVLERSLAQSDVGILGPWSFDRPMGGGAMGDVWCATDLRDGSRVAIKLLNDRATASARAVDSLFTEARSMARMRHRNLLQVLDHGHIDASAAHTSDVLHDGAPYLVLELAEGGDLTSYLGRMPWERCRQVLLETLNGLAHAHARDVMHLDIKPGNLLLRADGSVAIADFGIARAIGGHQNRVAGTPAFMAPEQWRGRWQSLGAWTDLYAVGMVAIELVQDHPAFADGSVVAMRRAHLMQLPTLEPCIPVPEGFDQWVLQLISKAPEHRFRSAARAAQALRSLGAPAGSTAPELPLPPRSEAPTVLHSSHTLCTIETVEFGDDESTWQTVPEAPSVIQRVWPSLHLRLSPPSTTPTATHIDLSAHWAALDIHDPAAMETCWSALREVTRTEQPSAIGLQTDTAELLEPFATSFLRTCREAGTMRPLYVRQEEASISGFLRRLVGLSPNQDDMDVLDGLMARGLDPALAQRVVDLRGHLAPDDIRAVLERLAKRSPVVVCIDRIPNRAAIAGAFRAARGPILSLWIEPDWHDPVRRDVVLAPPSAEQMAQVLTQATKVRPEHIEAILEGVSDPQHASARLAAHVVQGALVRRGGDTVLRRLPRSSSVTDERERLLDVAAAMGLDVGAMDVLRDRDDGRLYVVDVNKTDMGPPAALGLRERLRMVRALSRAFRQLVRERATA